IGQCYATGFRGNRAISVASSLLSTWYSSSVMGVTQTCLTAGSAQTITRAGMSNPRYPICMSQNGSNPELSPERFDVVVVGAGPTGLACAIDVKRAGLSVVNIDKGCLVNSLFNYPANMIFFTTPELLEIGDIPFSSANPKPNRLEALEYYRKVSEHYKLDVRQYQRVETVTGGNNGFHITTCDRLGRVFDYTCKKVIVATGYYDRANLLHIPGEDLPKVFHYYREPHPYFNNDVLVIGGKNSAAISALDLWRHGARVTLVHRGAKMHNHVKYWILPDIENRIKNGEITAYFRSAVKEIQPDQVTLDTPEG